jgi:hypothetical protein
VERRSADAEAEKMATAEPNRPDAPCALRFTSSAPAKMKKGRSPQIAVIEYKSPFVVFFGYSLELFSRNWKFMVSGFLE